MRFGGLIAAVVFAAIAAIVVLRMSAEDEKLQPTAAAPVPQNIKSVNIYVAKTPIAIGSTITEEMVGTQPWPEHLALPGFMNVDSKETPPIVGMVARGTFQQGEPLIAPKLANPNDPNFLAGELPAGMRVITVPLNETEGVAGFIFPGDHVDMIYTHDVDKWISVPSSDGSEPRLARTTVSVTETLLTNVKVLAVDQRASGANATDKNGNLIIPRSASVMVSQTDAQRIRLAQRTGTLTLALRALADKESADPLLLTGDKDISQSQGAIEGTGDAVKIVRGAPIVVKENESSNATMRGAPQVSGSTPIPPQVAAPANVNVPVSQ